MENKINFRVLDNNEIKDIPEGKELSYGAAQDKQIAAVDVEAQEVPLDVEGLPIQIEVVDIGSLPNEAYALLRRNGFGASDSSILLGVNPYKTIEELIKEKSTPNLSDEEKAIGEKVAVRKGNDLEPLIIHKYEKVFGTPTIKPTDMYQFKDYPYLKINYDGVTQIQGAYYPVEIKVCTYYGEKHYNKEKAMFSEGVGFRPIPENVSTRNWSIETKAAHYGIPPYYYTQVQQEMMGVGAPWGHLTVMFDKDWRISTFFIWKDEAIQHELILKGYKTWQKVEQARAAKGLTIADFTPDLSKIEGPATSKVSMLDFVKPANEELQLDYQY